MNRFPMFITAMAAAIFSALAVAIATSATTTPPQSTDKTPDVNEIISCVRAHGLAEAPTDPIAFKRWVGERVKNGDDDVERALRACEPAPAVEKQVPGKDDAQLRACLERHGAQIKGDDVLAIKRWVGEHMDDPSAQAAMSACKIGGLTKPDSACAAKAKPRAGDDGVKATRAPGSAD